jgi:hypothetical protein
MGWEHLGYESLDAIKGNDLTRMNALGDRYKAFDKDSLALGHDLNFFKDHVVAKHGAWFDFLEKKCGVKRKDEAGQRRAQWAMGAARERAENEIFSDLKPTHLNRLRQPALQAVKKKLIATAEKEGRKVRVDEAREAIKAFDDDRKAKPSPKPKPSPAASPVEPGANGRQPAAAAETKPRAEVREPVKPARTPEQKTVDEQNNVNQSVVVWENSKPVEHPVTQEQRWAQWLVSHVDDLGGLVEFARALDNLNHLGLTAALKVAIDQSREQQSEQPTSDIAPATDSDSPHQPAAKETADTAPRADTADDLEVPAILRRTGQEQPTSATTETAPPLQEPATPATPEQPPSSTADAIPSRKPEKPNVSEIVSTAADSVRVRKEPGLSVKKIVFQLMTANPKLTYDDLRKGLAARGFNSPLTKSLRAESLDPSEHR